MAIMGKTIMGKFLVYIKFTVYKRGWFLIQRIANFILNLYDNNLVASRLCMGKVHLKIRYHKRGLG